MVCGVHAGPLTTKGGLFTIQTPYTLDDLDRADTVIVPAWDVHVSTPPELCDALRRAHTRGARIASLCSGVFAVAAAGLLEGRRATTHWMWADELARRYPTIEVDPSVLYIDEGDVLTSAGTAAAIDLCLYMVRQDHGAEVANVFARRMIVPPHREGGQAQYVDTPVPPCDCDDLAATLDWAVHHLDEELTVEQLAARAAHVAADVRRVGSTRQRVRRRCSGCCNSACSQRDACSRRPICPSIRLPIAVVSARRRRCACTSVESRARRPRLTEPPSAPPSRVTRRAARPRWRRSLYVEGCARR